MTRHITQIFEIKTGYTGPWYTRNLEYLVTIISITNVLNQQFKPTIIELLLLVKYIINTLQ